MSSIYKLILIHIGASVFQHDSFYSGITGEKFDFITFILGYFEIEKGWDEKTAFENKRFVDK